MMPSCVSVVLVGRGVKSDTMLVPRHISLQSNPVPFRSAFAATTPTSPPTLAACATVTCTNLVWGARTSNAVANDNAMKRMRDTDEAISMMRRGSAIVEALNYAK